MSTRDRRKHMYRKKYQAHFDHVERVLAPFDGFLKWSEHDYEVFTFECDGVKLLFYPHKSKSGWYSLRVRNQGSSDKERMLDVMVRLSKFHYRVKNIGKLVLKHGRTERPRRAR